MSTHGLQWYGRGAGTDNCVTDAALDALANDWKADILRISMYIQEGGYETNPTRFTNEVSALIDEVTERGMYALVDWHMLSPGDPHVQPGPRAAPSSPRSPPGTPTRTTSSTRSPTSRTA